MLGHPPQATSCHGPTHRNQRRPCAPLLRSGHVPVPRAGCRALQGEGAGAPPHPDRRARAGPGPAQAGLSTLALQKPPLRSPRAFTPPAGGRRGSPRGAGRSEVLPCHRATRRRSPAGAPCPSRRPVSSLPLPSMATWHRLANRSLYPTTTCEGGRPKRGHGRGPGTPSLGSTAGGGTVARTALSVGGPLRVPGLECCATRMRTSAPQSPRRTLPRRR